jgi:hypothetical protein
VPVESVPVVASEAWLDDPAPTPAVEAGGPRFQSQDEDPEDESMDAGEPVFFAASGPVTSSIKVVGPPSIMEEVNQNEEFMDPPARPRFAEMAEERTSTPLPRDYASDFGSAVRPPAPKEESDAPEPDVQFPESKEAAERDLDVPAFMRRLPF